MKIMRWYKNGIRAAAVGAVAMVMTWCGNASAQPLPITVTVDENCNGTITVNNQSSTIPCAVQTDVIGGALAETFNLGQAGTFPFFDLFFLWQGQLLLTEDGDFSDVIRFEPSWLLANFGINSPSLLVFYSDAADGTDALADTVFFPPPGVVGGFTVTTPEVGSEGDNGATYTPANLGDPGFLESFAVTYVIHSDTSASVVPEPATLALLGLGLAGLGFSRRSRKQ